METGFGDATQPQNVAIGHPSTPQVERFHAHLHPWIRMMEPPIPQCGDVSFGTGDLDHRRAPSARGVVNRATLILSQGTHKVSRKSVWSIASAEGVPTLLVVFNNTGCDIHTNPYSVMTAMQGLDVINVSVPRDPALRPTFRHTHSGPERAMRADANTSTSAIAVLHDLGSEGMQLVVFHNRHATVPLSPDVLRIAGVVQFRLPEDATSSLEAPWSAA